ncbi:hypothetical protein M9434_004946 [Picochlorum sp. BPE23]|nr:hypothetical protein M9434_004946 [Picochlorum sp. BPE23]
MITTHGYYSGAGRRRGVYLTRNPRRRRGVTVWAFGASPYEPLERAIQIVNRVISIGEKAKWKSSDGAGEQGRETRERWVQFGAMTSAKVPVLLSEGVEEDVGSLLGEYLSLPTSEYSLLDPKWVERVEHASSGDFPGGEQQLDPCSDVFTVKVPLSELVGVDLTPTLSIVAKPHSGQGKVTFVGSRASLGSPGLDESFRLNVVAVLQSQGRRRRIPRIPTPDHIPGRPVSRLQKWAANARQKAPLGDKDSEAVVHVEEDINVLVDIEGQELADVDVQNLADSAPFPSEKIYLSQGDSVSEEEEEKGAGESREEVGQSSASANGTVHLHCRVNVTMAVRVPTALKVIPNPLLGYAGSLISKAVLNGAVPNFAELLTKDFDNWAKRGKSRDGDDTIGELFATVEK